MTDTISGLSKWTKEKLISEVMQLRNQRRESLNLANKNQDNNQELDRLKLELEHRKELYNQVQSEIQFLRSQNDKLISNLISEKTAEKDVVKSTVNRHFYPKFVPRFTKQLIISDSSYKLVRQDDISNDAAIHSYPSSTIKDLNNIIDNYAPSTKAECLIIHTGHNSIDQGTTGEDAAKELGVVLSKCVNKIKPYKVAICKLPKVKNGSFGRETNNNEINKFNRALDDIADGLRGEFQNTDIKVLDYNLENVDIRMDGIHPNHNGIQKMVFSLRNYISIVGYQPSVSNVSMRQIKKQPLDNVNNWNRNGHMGYNAFG